MYASELELESTPTCYKLRRKGWTHERRQIICPTSGESGWESKKDLPRASGAPQHAEEPHVKVQVMSGVVT
jgi:hypothetical protein